MKIILVTHINYPQETNNNLSSLLKLKQSGMILLNESVLLNNNNDNFIKKN
jgi:L-lysine 2,3-aminomutase